MIGEATLKYLDKSLEQDLAAELRAQGHYLTGELERSITSTVTEDANGATLEVDAEDYIEQLETGVPASDIVISDQYIADLTVYAKLRFHVNDVEARRIAKKIAHKHSQEGMPTGASYAYSKTGKRTEVMEDTYNTHEELYDQIVEDSLSYEVDELIDQTFPITDF